MIELVIKESVILPMVLFCYWMIIVLKDQVDEDNHSSHKLGMFCTTAVAAFGIETMLMIYHTALKL